MAHKTIYVKTTGACNLDCKHCFTNGRDGDKTQFDPVVVGDWLEDYMSRHNPNDTSYHMEFHGGEPFLVPLEKLQVVADRFYGRHNVTMCANSNLTFKLYPAHIEFMKKYFHSYIGTSWDHWIRWSNQKQFELWKSNLALLNSHGIGISLKVSVSRELIASTADWFIDQIEQFGVHTVALERLTCDGSAEDNSAIFPDNEEQDNWYLALYLRYKERKPNFTIRTLDIIEQKLKTGMVKVDTNCRNCEQNMVTMNSDGTLGCCPNVATTREHATLEQGVDAFFNSDSRAQDIAEELTWGDTCLTCDVFDLCGGDCHQLPWQKGRCGGLKNTLRYLSGRNLQTNLIFKV